MTRLPHNIAVALAISCALVPSVRAQQDTVPRGVRIGLTYDPSTKPGLVVLPVAGALGDSVRAIIARDLDYSDRIIVVPLDATPVASRQANGSLNYSLYARLGAVGVVQATITPTGLRVVLHDVGKKAVAGSQDFTLPGPGLGRDWRMGVHVAADEIENWVTGQRGIAQTRIAYVRSGVIRVIDSDGAFDTALPPAGDVVSPSWNPTGTAITYSTFGVNSRIYVLDLRTAKARMLAATPYNTNITPVFTPDGSTIVYAHSGEGGTDLFSVTSNGNGQDARRISVGHGWDNTNPSFNPDGRRIAFTSGRLGHPEIYVMDADGTNADLLTTFDFGDQNYRSDPDWSPDGRLIAFQSMIAGRFQVLTISLRDRSTKLLTNDGINEQPSWAPDARHLVFTSTRSGTRQLWIVDAESGRMRQLTHTAPSRLGAWSPRLGAQVGP